MNTESHPLEGASLQEASQARREQLYRAWPTAAMVDRGMGHSPQDAAQACLVTTRLRQEGKLLGAYVVPSNAWAGHYRYPTWQLDEKGGPIGQMGPILSILRGRGRFGNKEGLATGWGEVEWFVRGHALLDGKSPAQTLAIDPEGVLAAARREFHQPRDAGW